MNTENLNQTLPGVPVRREGAARDPVAVRRRLSRALRTVILWIAVFALSYVAAGQPFLLRTHPFGIALLCSVTGTEVAALAGCVLAARATMEESFLYAVLYMSIFLARVVFSILFYKGGFPPAKQFFRESVGARTGVACLAAFAVGTYELIEGGFLYYDVFRMAFFAVEASALTYLMAGGLDGTVKRAGSYRGLAAGVVLMLVAVLGEAEPGGIHVGLMLAVAAVLYAARYLGAARAAGLGVLLALPLEASFLGEGFALTSALGAAGLASGLFFGMSSYLAVASAALLAIGCAVFSGGYTALLAMAPETVASAVLMYPILKFDVLPRPKRKKKEEFPHRFVEKYETKCREETLMSLSKTFSALSGVLASFSRKNRGIRKETREICTATCNQYCGGCASKVKCWEENRAETVEAVEAMTETLRARGTLDEEAIPRALVSRCSQIHKLVEEINEKSAAEVKAAAGRDKIEAFSVDYDAISRLFRQVLADEKELLTADEPLTAKIRYGARKAKFPSGNIYVYGKRKKYIVVEDVEVARLDLGCEDVKTLFENISGLRLTPPEFSIDGRHVTMTLHTAKRFGTESSYYTSMINGESVNGDMVNTFNGYDDRFYALISDGMGSGSDAAMTSGLCSMFLEKLLSGGNNKTIALQLLNNFIRSKSVECSATVDLAEIDLLTGEASFAKSGAAPSFVKRGTDIFKLQSKTIPIGIIRELDSEQLRFTLMTGDVVVMISDGVASGFEESGWLIDLLDENWTDDLDEMNRRILEGAKENNLRTDDMTVCLIRVTDAKTKV